MASDLQVMLSHSCLREHTHMHVHRAVRRIRTSAELPTPSSLERWYIAVLTWIYSVLSSLASPSPTHPELPFVFLALFSVSFQLIAISSQPWGRIHTHPSFSVRSGSGWEMRTVGEHWVVAGTKTVTRTSVVSKWDVASVANPGIKTDPYWINTEL